MCGVTGKRKQRVNFPSSRSLPHTHSSSHPHLSQTVEIKSKGLDGDLVSDDDDYVPLS